MTYSFGDKLKGLRNERGLTLDELANKLNDKYNTSLNKGMISKWENNYGEPRLETAKVIALFFNISLDDLLGIAESEEIETIAAHHDGDNWSEAELEEIEKFKEFVRMKRQLGE